MLLFQPNGEPLLFHLINIEDAERAALAHLIESEGGGVTDNDDVTVMFTSRDAYIRNGPLLRAKLYDVAFIKECIRQEKIVSPEHYRLGNRSGRDDYHVHHFLHGKCQDARYSMHCRCGRRQETSGKTVSSQDNLGTSDASPQILDLRLRVSSLAGGDSPAIEDCATEDAGSPLNRRREECRDSSTNWDENPRRLSEVGRVANVEEDGSTNMDVAEQVAIPNLIDIPPDVNAAGPSGIRNTAGSSRVRNLAHPFFRAKRIRVEENIQEPEAQLDIAKKSSRGKEWRAKLKGRTDEHYTRTNSRMPFTPSEQKIMMRYLIENECIHRAKGLVVWTNMIIDGYLTDRTPQSLQNHFRKSILPNIENIDWLENSDRVKFLALRSVTKGGKTS